MTYFEPPPLPGGDRAVQGGPSEPSDPYAPSPPRQGWHGPSEPGNPYASPAQQGWPGPSPAAPWGAPAPRPHPQGTAILVMGILSVTAMWILGPFAWVMARRALREIDSSGQPCSNRGSVQAGLVLGIVGTCMGVLGMLWFLSMFGILLSGMSM